MKIIISELKKLIKEALQDSVSSTDEINDSLDTQVDKIFIKYEKEASDAVMNTKSESFSLRGFLLEADDDGDDSDELNLDDVEKDAESSTGSDNSDATGKKSTDSINMNSFADNVVRLIENYDNLLEVRNTILRRAEVFLDKNYDGDAVNTFKDALKEHDIEIGKSQQETELDEFPAPSAERAGPSPGGPT